MYSLKTGNLDEAIKLAKTSVINTTKLMGANSLVVADKQYQLGNILFRVGKKEEAFQ